MHRSKETDEVFYVGKGSGKRAWNSKKRNPNWKSKVEELDGNWKVEIYDDDLTENEAFRLEEKLVKEFGFFDDENDQLTNRFPGGDMPATFTIGADYGKSDWEKAYEKFRQFKKLDKSEKNYWVKKLHKELGEIFERLWNLDNEVDYTKEIDDEDIEFLPSSIIGGLEDAFEASKDFPKNRISWKRFCLDLEYSYDSLTRKCYQDNNTNAQKFSKTLFQEYKKSLGSIRRVYEKIDTGNKEEAKRLANQAVTNIPLKISSQIPYQANAIQILSKKTSEELFENICQVIASNGYKIKHKDSDNLTIETRFIEFEADITLQINVSVEETKNYSVATLRGRIKDSNLSKLFAKRGKPEISFESKWCKTKYPRLSFGKIAVLVNQEITQGEINYLGQK